ncbi:MAG: hypothetical protein ACREJU_19290, partial [Nitrospiraceae bacterium]
MGEMGSRIPQRFCYLPCVGGINNRAEGSFIFSFSHRYATVIHFTPSIPLTSKRNRSSAKAGDTVTSSQGINRTELAATGNDQIKVHDMNIKEER